MKLLRIDSSARAGSVSRQLTTRYVDAWRSAHPDGEIIERDLSATSLPPITDAWTELSDMLIAELVAADVIVIGAPMYNFTISWPLKAWIDQVVRLNRTVAYGADGPRGLLIGKEVVVLTSRGGSYGDRAESDFQEPYLRRIFTFMGVEHLTFIHAERQYRRGADAVNARNAALAHIDELFATHHQT